MIRPACAWVAMMVVIGTAHADPSSHCAGATQTALNQCAGAELKQADAAMNAAYGKLMEQIGPKARDGLRDAQKAWLPFRDKSCALEALGSEGGSIQPMIRAVCLAKLTTDRTKALKAYLACPEGDLACVGRFSD